MKPGQTKPRVRVKMNSSAFKLDQRGYTEAARSYGAAGGDDFIHSWLKQPESIDSLIKNSLSILRARSREQVQNNDYARRFIGMVKTHVVGPDGFVFQARTTDLDGTLDKLANDAIEDNFNDWSKRGNCDVTGRLSFKEMQRLIVSTVAEDGECFVIRSMGGQYKYQLQLLDVEQLPVKYSGNHTNGNLIKFGVEIDVFGKPVAYHFTSDQNGDSYPLGGVHYRRVPAEDVYHVYLPEKVNQKRGIPWMSTALLRMKMLNGFEDAALVNARVGASKMGFFTSADGRGYEGDSRDADGSIISEVTPGTLEQLPDGVDFKTFDPTYPSNEFGTFVSNALRGISSGLGVSYHKLGNDLSSVNYSSGRLGELEDRETWKTLQDWLTDTFLVPVYEDWLVVQLNVTENIKVNGSALKPDRELKYKKVTFQGRRWQWVDPQKEVNAQEKQIALGLRSRSDIIREQGRDPDDVWLEMQREKERMKDLGIYSEPITAQPNMMPDPDN